MKKLVEYKIISGNVIETRRTYMSARNVEGKSRRAPKVAGSSSESKIKANERECARELARRINANFSAGDAHLVLKYDEVTLPADYAGAEERIGKFLRKYKAEFKKTTGRTAKAIWVTADRSPRRQAGARLHHHLILEREGRELAVKLWGESLVSYEALDGRLDHSELAAYLIANVSPKAGKNKYHCTRNMVKPIYTEPVEVDDIEDVRQEKDAVIKEHSVVTDEDGRVTSSYLRVTLGVKPKVRGGRLCIPKKSKRGGHKC